MTNFSAEMTDSHSRSLMSQLPARLARCLPFPGRYSASNLCCGGHRKGVVHELVAILGEGGERVWKTEELSLSFDHFDSLLDLMTFEGIMKCEFSSFFGRGEMAYIAIGR